VIFLHALGVELLRSTGKPLRASLNRNPTGTSKLFKAFLDEVENELDAEEKDIFTFVFSCPIWGFALSEYNIIDENHQESERNVKEIYYGHLKNFLSEPEALYKVDYSPRKNVSAKVDFPILLNSIPLLDHEPSAASQRKRGPAPSAGRPKT
jgi:hypothetical protein